MKKFICIAISVFLVMTTGVAMAFAKDNGHNKGGYAQSVSYEIKDIDQLKQQMLQYYRDIEKRKEILKEIRKLKQRAGKLEKEEQKLEKKAQRDALMCFINGVEMESDVPPVVKYGRTLVPIRALTTALGADVKWNPDTHVVTITKNGMVIELKLGSDIVIVNGKEWKIDVPAENMNNRVVVPIRFIAEAFNQKVEWDEATGTIIISKGDNTNNGGNQNQNPNPSTVTVNDNTTGTANNQFEYYGDWSYGYQTGAYNNDNHWAVTTDVYYQVRFTGTQIKLYGAKDPGFGIASVTVDETIGTNVDFYAATRSDNTLLYTSPVLANGPHILKVKVTGTKNSSSSNYYVNADRVDIITANTTTTNFNLALNKTAVASSTYDSNLVATKAVDGSTGTYWSSQFSDPQWIYVDLGAAQNIGKVKLSWETAYAKSYKIQVSNDAANWTDVYTTTTGDGGEDTITFTQVSARYVRVYGTQRGTNYGYSLYEFEVYNQ